MKQRKARVRHYPPCREDTQELDKWFGPKLLGGILTIVTCTTIGLNVGPALLGYPSSTHNEETRGLALALSMAGALPGFLVGTVLAKKIDEM
jgi:hypothetical protein